MCVILACGPGVPLPPPEHIVNANLDNPHGWGVSINLPKACRVHRGLSPVGTCRRCRSRSQVAVMRGFDTGALLDAVDRLEALRTPASSLVVHCRIGTGGTNTLDNTHPFPITDKLALFHNGIFSEATVPTETNPKKPDSYHLANAIAPAVRHNPSWIHAPLFTTWLDALCRQPAYQSKVLLLDAVYGQVLYNRTAWVDGGDGRLYSNDGPLWRWIEQTGPSPSVDWVNEDIGTAGYAFDPFDDETSDLGFATWKDDHGRYSQRRRLEDLEEEAEAAFMRENEDLVACVRGYG